jgi:hypothetical protein
MVKEKLGAIAYRNQATLRLSGKNNNDNNNNNIIIIIIIMSLLSFDNRPGHN